jgi:hypothetical protein
LIEKPQGSSKHPMSFNVRFSKFPFSKNNNKPKTSKHASKPQENSECDNEKSVIEKDGGGEEEEEGDNYMFCKDINNDGGKINADKIDSIIDSSKIDRETSEISVL